MARSPSRLGRKLGARKAAYLDAFDIMSRHDRNDQHFDDVGQHTQKRLPKLSWQRIARPGVSVKVMLAVFFGTFAVLTLICLAFIFRA
jgi:hypothetical protein